MSDPLNTTWPEAVTVVQLEELRRKKLDAEKDRDLFRSLYSKASAHASEVTKENNELLERAERAEAQVKDGLAMIKGMYHERIRLLEMEVQKWQGQAALLATRDQRTAADDELRKRAAAEPELRAENERLKAMLWKLQDDYDHMEATLAQIGEQELEDPAPPTLMLEVPDGRIPLAIGAFSP